MANADYIHGMNVMIVFKNSSNEKSLYLLKEMGMPFVRPEENQPHAKAS